MPSKIYLKDPAYYNKFRCTGADCYDNCCQRWRIDWKETEVEKLKAADCSEKLRALIDSSFEKIPSLPDMYAIVFSEKDKRLCPFNEEGLCSIQKELGEEYLSRTCRIYPRMSIWSNSFLTRVCHASCYKVLEILCNEKKAWTLLQGRKKSKTFL